MSAISVFLTNPSLDSNTSLKRLFTPAPTSSSDTAPTSSSETPSTSSLSTYPNLSTSDEERTSKKSPTENDCHFPSTSDLSSREMYRSNESIGYDTVPFRLAYSTLDMNHLAPASMNLNNASMGTETKLHKRCDRDTNCTNISIDRETELHKLLNQEERAEDTRETELHKLLNQEEREEDTHETELWKLMPQEIKNDNFEPRDTETGCLSAL